MSDAIALRQPPVQRVISTGGARRAAAARTPARGTLGEDAFALARIPRSDGPLPTSGAVLGGALGAAAGAPAVGIFAFTKLLLSGRGLLPLVSGTLSAGVAGAFAAGSLCAAGGRRLLRQGLASTADQPWTAGKVASGAAGLALGAFVGYCGAPFTLAALLPGGMWAVTAAVPLLAALGGIELYERFSAAR